VVEQLPAGTVTMLFSDIEGSTAMVSRLGDQYGEALSAHRVLLRAEFAAWHGREMSTEGDSFFVVFGSASDAVQCCLAAQRALAAYDWPAGAAVRVRMGLHSGEPTAHEGNYIGLDVHRAARIAATAHGGQVVMSEATRLLAAPRLADGVSVRDLGFHRLKDIPAPERIYQLTGPGLRADFPPPKSLGAQTSLPVPVTPLIGREHDLDRVRAAITHPGARLVTLTGAGGVGKTRLAIATATSLDTFFPHGVFFVALAAVTDADVMWKVIGDTLDVTMEGQAADAVTGHLAKRTALLVLDNLEQLDGANAVVAALLAAAPGLTVLATSRGPLHVQGEHELPVPALEISPTADPAAVMASAAARLFAQQAAMVRPGFVISADNAAEVAAICRRLDGLPLAIELAASRARLLAPRALLARLGDSLGLGTGDAGRPSRQQTLRNTVAWSYDLLDPDLARVFRRMSVFASGCDLDALAAVTMTDADPAGSDPLELAAALQDVSLITVTEGGDGEPRLGMLETIRSYARERLAQQDDLDGVRRRHAEYYTAYAEQASEQLHGPSHMTALDRLEAEHDNLRAALAWSLAPPEPAGVTQGERAVIGLRLVQALSAFWYQHGHATEGRRWLQRAVDVASADGGPSLAHVAHGLGVLLDQQGDADAARLAFERSLAIWRELGDLDEQGRELNSLGITHRRLGNIEVARRLLEEAIAIARQSGNDLRLGSALANLSQLESAVGHNDRAIEAAKEALTVDQRLGDPFGVAIDRHSLALISVRAGRPQEARDLVVDVFEYLATSSNTSFLLNTMELAAVIVAALDDPALSARLLGAAQTLRHEAGMHISPQEAEMVEDLLAPARAVVTAREWEAGVAAGRALSREEALALLRRVNEAGRRLSGP
jgi:predicted ATPase/class 3 adenylate cyclase